MAYKEYFFKVIGVVVLAWGIFVCSTHFASANKVQKFFKDHSAQDQVIFEKNNDAQRAYETLLNFCNHDEKKLDQVHDIKKLTGGLSSAIIFEFVFQGHSYVGRLFSSYYNQQKILQGVNAQSAVADLEYAPKIYLYDLQRRSVIMDCVLGKNLNDPALKYDESLLEKCAETLRAMHKITQSANPDLPIHEYPKNRIGLVAQALIQTCTKILPESMVIQELQNYAQQLCGIVDNTPHPVTLVHNDFHCGNVLIDHVGSIKIIDWTGAGYDNPLNDCVIFLQLYPPALKNRELFLRYYFQRDPSIQESALLRILGCLYRIEVIGLLQKVLKQDVPHIDCIPDRSFDEYLEKYFQNQDIIKNPEFLTLAIKSGIAEVKQYMSQRFDEDKELICSPS